MKTRVKEGHVNPLRPVLHKMTAKASPMPDQNVIYRGVNREGNALKPIPFKDLKLNGPWTAFDLNHDFTREGYRNICDGFRKHTSTTGKASADMQDTILHKPLHDIFRATCSGVCHYSSPDVWRLIKRRDGDIMRERVRQHVHSISTAIEIKLKEPL